MSTQETENETTIIDYLRDLADRLWQIPPMYGVDEGDVESVKEIASRIERAIAVVFDPEGEYARGGSASDAVEDILNILQERLT